MSNPNKQPGLPLPDQSRRKVAPRSRAELRAAKKVRDQITSTDSSPEEVTKDVEVRLRFSFFPAIKDKIRAQVFDYLGQAATDQKGDIFRVQMQANGMVEMGKKQNELIKVIKQCADNLKVSLDDDGNFTVMMGQSDDPYQSLNG